MVLTLLIPDLVVIKMRVIIFFVNIIWIQYMKPFCLNMDKKDFTFFVFLRLNDLFGPLIFTVVNLKKRPTSPARMVVRSYDMGSCPVYTSN